jgi:hypothetical protein
VRSRLKIVAVSVLVLVGVVIIHEIISPYTPWYFVVPNARLTVDGEQAQGWLHRGNHRETLFLTRCDVTKAESYLIWVPHGGHGAVWSCGNWTAPRFPVFPIGDVNPPCLTFTFGEGSTPKAILPARHLVLGTDFVEFTADDGSRIKASW